MNQIKKNKLLILAGTCITTVLLYILFNKYYNVNYNHADVKEKSTILNVGMMLVSLILGWITAVSILNLRETIKFIKISFENKTLIKSLSRNDFKNKFASSYLGIIWAFIHPLVTICVYWFVFQVAFAQGNVKGPAGDVPYILWFICGIIPWFFFSEAFSTTSNVLLEYSYLVKKVVFKIEVLPAIKIISSLFVHVFFVLLIFVAMAVCGSYPDAYSFQCLYYSFALICLIYAVSIVTSTVILFFRDLGQIINIILSVGFWFTPIGWMITRIPESIRVFIKLNPLYYIVTGYRDSFIDKTFFWQRPYETLYFWVLCLVILCLGTKMYYKLKPHFSDVL